MLRVRRALISVSDKTGIVHFAKELNNLGVEILSTGGSARLLRENNISVREVSAYTGFSEMLDGRVKTLHPKIHAGLLALRDNPAHMKAINEHNIGLIDMVVVNLYPFQNTIRKTGVTLEEAVENIDIGGPTMLRSAAKNYRFVAVICRPRQYGDIIKELKEKGGLCEETLYNLAIEVFDLTSDYDNAIASYLSHQPSDFPLDLTLKFRKIQDLRYGENPHQRGAFYKEKGENKGLINLRQLQGKELSFNNILDLNSVWGLVKEFKEPAAVVAKHNNPCGAAEDKTLDKAYLGAWRCDTLSAFGGIVALNRKLDLKTARLIAKSGFLECIIAPSFEKEALDLLKSRKNLRLLELDESEAIQEYDYKRVESGLLLQDKDLQISEVKQLKVVTRKRPTPKQLEGLIFAWKVVKHVKSNAIVLARGRKTVGIGAGQMSRVDSVIIARRKAGKLTKGCCLASDAFFPKEDAIVQAARAGVVAIIQPGGSIRDKQVISACDKYKIAMVFTGIRHFKH
jgi:phosphoribosylaminoimidazolecarboxamide formyltransferase/IMP cyclohydrolase